MCDKMEAISENEKDESENEGESREKVIEDIREDTNVIIDEKQVYETEIPNREGKFDNGHFLQVEEYEQNESTYWLTYIHNQNEGYGWVLYDKKHAVEKANEVLREINEKNLTYDDIIDWAPHYVWNGSSREIPREKRV